MTNRKPAQKRTLVVLDLRIEHDHEYLTGVVRKCGPAIVTESAPPMMITIGGYDTDKRELWEIPAVRDLAKRVEASGLTGLMRPNLGERIEGFLGAWDIYALARGLIRSGVMHASPADIESFQAVLLDANQLVNSVVKGPHLTLVDSTCGTGKTHTSAVRGGKQ